MAAELHMPRGRGVSGLGRSFLYEDSVAPASPSYQAILIFRLLDWQRFFAGRVQGFP